jgi:uncharacterized phiE125 gp8 family phage protein
VGLKIAIAPIEEPVTLAEAQLHLRVDHNDELDLINSLLRTARDFCERFTNRQFVTATYDLTIDRFPTQSFWSSMSKAYVWESGDIILPKPPLQSVTSITYVDGSGMSQTLSATVYEVDTGLQPGAIRLKYDQMWPSIRDQKNAITIKFKAGYGPKESVPETIKAAIKLMLGHLYENREATLLANRSLEISELPFGISSLLWGYKSFGVM